MCVMLRIFVLAGPCVMGPAGELSGPAFPLAGRIPVFMGNMQQPAMGRYARIILDRWFKRSFLFQKDSLRLLQLFLQEVIPEHDIVEIRTDNVEHINLLDDNKDVRVDVECYDKDGTRFVCEVQVSPQHHFYERAVFNSTLAIQKQKQAGEGDYDFPTVYFIGLMDFTCMFSWNFPTLWGGR